MRFRPTDRPTAADVGVLTDDALHRFPAAVTLLRLLAWAEPADDDARAAVAAAERLIDDDYADPEDEWCDRELVADAVDEAAWAASTEPYDVIHLSDAGAWVVRDRAEAAEYALGTWAHDLAAERGPQLVDWVVNPDGSGHLLVILEGPCPRTPTGQHLPTPGLSTRLVVLDPEHPRPVVRVADGRCRECGHSPFVGVGTFDGPDEIDDAVRRACHEVHAAHGGSDR